MLQAWLGQAFKPVSVHTTPILNSIFDDIPHHVTNTFPFAICTGILSHLGAKLCDWAIRRTASLGQHCPQMTSRPAM